MKRITGWRRWPALAAVMLMTLTTAVAAHEDDDDEDKRAGAVFTMNNAVGGNEVLVYHRSSDGALTAAGSVPTGGLGTGAGLGNQEAVVLSDNNRWLFVVNPGSNDVSVFSQKRGKLKLVDRVASGGVQPISVTFDRGLLYVLNAGDPGNITGFTLSRHGKLTPLPGSTRPLSGPGTGPAQVSFNPEGDLLVVTEKASNNIDVYAVGKDGLATGPQVYPSAGPTPFGFAFDRRGRLYVSEAAGGAPDAGSVSSYRLSDSGSLTAISPVVATTETAACWVVVTGNGRYAYTTNAGSGSITGYRIRHGGTIELLDADGRTGDTGAGSAPLDMALTRNSRFLYSLNSGNGTLGAFRVKKNGALVALPGVGGLPPGTNGLAAF